MTTIGEVLRQADDADVELVRLVFVNNSGVPRGRVVDVDGLRSAFESGVNVTRAMQSFNALDRVAPDGSYGPVGEVRVTPDPETFTVLPYDDRAAIALADLRDLDGEPWAAGPRAQLRRYLDEVADRGFEPTASFESEFYYLRETDEGDLEPFDDTTCFSTAGMRSAHDVILDTVDALDEQGMGLSAYYPEYGPGQQELVIDHDTGVSAADNYVLFRETVEAVANDHGLEASFRPKPFPELPGTGCHVHLSLWEGDENAFYDPDADGHSSDADGHYPLSETGRQFVGGVLEHAPALVALTAPTVESYDRLAPGTWSSAFTCWGHDNREAAVRVPSVASGNPEATTRFEFKPADNTTNPYLALLGLLAAGLDGVDRELDPGDPLDRDPSALSDDECAERGIERLPATLEESVDALAEDEVLREAMGNALFESYVEVKRSEWEQSTDDEGEWESEYLGRGF